jgi:two-component system cell cycle response regulator DivK
MAAAPDRRNDNRFHLQPRHATMSLILIVEDNERNLKLVRDVLQVKGFTTVEAGTAEIGIELAAERKPDLILMDIQLPGMNGIDALKVLRANPATAAIPVVAVTASVMQQDRTLITQAGFDGYIGKPINIKEFLESVKNALAKKPS